MNLVEKVKSALFGPPEQRAQRAYTTGLDALSRGDRRLAERRMRQAVRLVPGSGTFQVGLGNLHLLNGDMEAALQSYAAAHEAGESSAILFSNWGVALRLSGDAERAAEFHERAIAVAPTDSETLLSAVVTFVQLGRTDDAMKLLNQVLREDPENASAHFNLAMLHDPADDEGFLAHIEHVLRSETLRPRALLLKALRLVRRGQADDAAASLEAALDADPALLSEIELDADLAELRALDCYKTRVERLPRRMFTCFSEAVRISDMGQLKRGERRSVVVLVMGRHRDDACSNAGTALRSAGWDEFDLTTMLPADRRGVETLGASAHLGWKRAEEHGVHFFVFEPPTRGR